MRLTEVAAEPAFVFRVVMRDLRELARVEPHARAVVANINFDVFIICFRSGRLMARETLLFDLAIGDCIDSTVH